jgi:hypothetical protein
MIYINTSYYDSIYFEDKNKELHRLNGPAVISEKRQIWWKHGKRHRLDGPAIIDGDYQRWYINGEYFYLETEYYNKLKEMGLE